MRLKAMIEVEYEVSEKDYDKCGHVDIEDVILCQEQCRIIDKVANLNLVDHIPQNIKVRVEEMK